MTQVRKSKGDRAGYRTIRVTEEVADRAEYLKRRLAMVGMRDVSKIVAPFGETLTMSHIFAAGLGVIERICDKSEKKLSEQSKRRADR
jgi:hypothetical protein